jgi:hypothetical protein
MEAGAKFCSRCGAPAGCPPDSETVVREGLCNRVKSKLFVQNGHGMLTTRRFVYSTHSLAKIAAIGALVNLTKGTFDFEIPLSEITEIREGRQGISKTLLLVVRSGEKYNFYFSNRLQWESDFRRLLSGQIR